MKISSENTNVSAPGSRVTKLSSSVQINFIVVGPIFQRIG